MASQESFRPVKSGDRIWFVDKRTNEIANTVVLNSNSEYFWFRYAGKYYRSSFNYARGKVFLSKDDLIQHQNSLLQGSPSLPGSPPGSDVPAQRSVKPRNTAFSVFSARNTPDLIAPDPSGSFVKSCDTCARRKNESCSSLRNTLCDDYKAYLAPSASDRDALINAKESLDDRHRRWRR